MLSRIYLILILAIIQSNAFGQDITAKGYFLKDSIKIGAPLPYILTIKYPKALEILFPDSLHNFSPFELSSKSYFPTKSDSVFSRDSAIYYLSTFEIDSIQYLKMPLYQINEFDSIIFWTLTDSVVLNQVVTVMPDSIAMVTNTAYVEVPMAFNYPYALAAFVLIIILLLILWFVFGNTLKKKIKLYRLKKKNDTFNKDFGALVTKDYLQAEEILTLWKSYLEKLQQQPFTKLTTKEIVSLLKQPTTEKSLMAIDRNIYGPKNKSLLKEAYEAIKSIAQAIYIEKITTITNG